MKDPYLYNMQRSRTSNVIDAHHRRAGYTFVGHEHPTMDYVVEMDHSMNQIRLHHTKDVSDDRRIFSALSTSY
ncbi:hypothetical protein P10VF_211 [Rhizobium phage vB_RleM_P10VF]|uniref:Uncharacterized protein n=1 Tax=Rhizobium phage vB_RleM_P10VF TaxID=1527770 RepID=A0A076YNP0_9CAUD|nr:hypothetical protein P10VF_211 [Rhizobium phage vB_RleM_P10VF]AIK68424.1 hypothetical protein P10VF_211 [Rhizobium phage vB_RleM_P10VF]